MKTLLAVLLAALIICPVIFVGGCQQCPVGQPAAAATPSYSSEKASTESAGQNTNDNGSEWYGSDAGDAWQQ